MSATLSAGGHPLTGSTARVTRERYLVAGSTARVTRDCSLVAGYTARVTRSGQTSEGSAVFVACPAIFDMNEASVNR